MRIREVPLALEPVSRDPFLDGLDGSVPAHPGADAHAVQVARVRASLIARPQGRRGQRS